MRAIIALQFVAVGATFVGLGKVIAMIVGA